MGKILHTNLAHGQLWRKDCFIMAQITFYLILNIGKTLGNKVYFVVFCLKDIGKCGTADLGAELPYSQFVQVNMSSS